MPRFGAAPVSVLALAIVSCGGGGPVMLYPGPARDRSQIAVIRRSGGADIRILRIDESNTRGFEWHVAPGPHRLWVELKQYGEAMNVSFKAWMYCPIDFEAEAGGAYKIISENGQRRAAVDTEVTLGVRMVDASDAIVGTPGSCTDRRPRFE